jgi:outer membrane lipoprotein-sorting protein
MFIYVNLNNMDKNLTYFVLLFGIIFTIFTGIVVFSVILDSDRNGEEIFSDVQEKYNNSDSKSVETTVSIENKDEKTVFDLDVAKEGNKYRVNISDEKKYWILGTNGDNIWVFNPRTELTGVIEFPEEYTAVTRVRAGTEDLSGDLSSIIPESINDNTTVSQLRQQFGDILPQEIEDIEGNTTISELSEELDNSTIASITEDLDRSQQPEDQFNTEDIDLNTTFDNINSSFTNMSSDNQESLYEEIIGDVLENIGDLRLIYNVGSDFSDSNSTSKNSTEITKIGTTRISGEDVNELLVNYSGVNAQERLYVSKNDDTILKQKIYRKDSLITIKYHETNFDVQPASSTFEPTGVTEIANSTLDIERFNIKDNLNSSTSLNITNPNSDWRFKNGTSVEILGNLPDAEYNVSSAFSKYIQGNTTIIVGQLSPFNIKEKSSKRIMYSEDFDRRNLKIVILG